MVVIISYIHMNYKSAVINNVCCSMKKIIVVR